VQEEVEEVKKVKEARTQVSGVRIPAAARLPGTGKAGFPDAPYPAPAAVTKGFFFPEA